jgi:hypothetical protein
MSLDALIDVISGETGVIALLVFALLYLVNGKVYPKMYVEDLKQTNKTLVDSIKELTESQEIIAATSVEALENSRTTLRILEEARRRTGVKGDDVTHE